MKIAIDLADGDWNNCQKIVEALAGIKSNTTPFACLTISLEGKEIEAKANGKSIYTACKKAVNEHNFDGKCTEECRQAILDNMERKYKQITEPTKEQ